MDLLSREEFKTLVGQRQNECVSLYMPTHRAGPEIQQDPLRLKNLLREAEDRLVAHNLRAATARALLAPAQRLVEDESFWWHQSEGLAIFLAPAEFYHYRLPLQLTEQVVVTNRFYLKPLLPLFNNNTQFFILALSQNNIRLLRCTQHQVAEVSLQDIPTNMDAALQYDNVQRQPQFHTGTQQFQSGARSGQGQRAAMFHGQGVGIDDTKPHILRFFQELNKGLQKILHDERAPLILAGVEYLFPIYREANTYPHLTQEGIIGNPEEWHPQELQRQGWTMLQPVFHQAQHDAAARYHQLAGTGRASQLLAEIVPAAYQGRIETLFVAVDAQQWGTFGPAENTVTVHPKAQPGDEDLLDFAAIHAFLNKGTVYAVSSPEMPSHELLAAIFRY